MLSDPVILLWEISTKLEAKNVETLYKKKTFLLDPLLKNKFQEMSTCTFEWKHVVKVSKHMHVFSCRYSCNSSLRMRYTVQVWYCRPFIPEYKRQSKVDLYEFKAKWST